MRSKKRFQSQNPVPEELPVVQIPSRDKEINKFKVGRKKRITLSRTVQDNKEVHKRTEKNSSSKEKAQEQKGAGVQASDVSIMSGLFVLF